MIRAFIFDLDGVLTDTAEYHFLAWKQLADEEGIPFTREDNEALRGVSRRKSLDLMLQGREISEELAQSWMARKNSYYQKAIKNLSPSDVLPGSINLLIEIKQRDLLIAIASASKNAMEVIERLQLMQYVDMVCDGTCVDKPKPAPDQFIYTAEQLGVHPSECVVIEDAEAGIQAAKASKMYSIGLGPIDRVGQADLIFSNLKECNLNEILVSLKEIG
jgi:beta-phosphoglucomutase